ncbi:MAG: hypothetical protein ACJ76N_24695 [Thermoanaerobaculia bacterium]
MSQQSAYIQAKNQTGATIQQGFVTHATESYGIQTISINNLADGDPTPAIAVNTGPSSTDYWWIGWTNDGTNWVTWMGTSAIHGHGELGNPGTVALVDKLGEGGLEISFTVNNESTVKDPIPNPWS